MKRELSKRVGLMRSVVFLVVAGLMARSGTARAQAPPILEPPAGNKTSKPAGLFGGTCKRTLS